uniref:Uncharacterized protein n=1 Tax=Anguilla anguilla TaxID=7936 RepID=A0A0E9TKD1_ANGAN
MNCVLVILKLRAQCSLLLKKGRNSTVSVWLT